MLQTILTLNGVQRLTKQSQTKISGGASGGSCRTDADCPTVLDCINGKCVLKTIEP